MTGEGTGKVPKRFKTAVVGNIYSSEEKRVVKRYLEGGALQDWANNALGDDDLGAETIEVFGSGHEGGTVRGDPFHFNVRVKDRNGGIIKTTNPRTGQKTRTWHAYGIAENGKDLYNKAKESDGAQKKSSCATGAKAEALAQPSQPSEGVVDDKQDRVDDSGGGPDDDEQDRVGDSDGGTGDDDGQAPVAAPDIDMDDQSTKGEPGGVIEPTSAFPDDDTESFHRSSFWKCCVCQ